MNHEDWRKLQIFHENIRASVKFLRTKVVQLITAITTTNPLSPPNFHSPTTIGSHASLRCGCQCTVSNPKLIRGRIPEAGGPEVHDDSAGPRDEGHQLVGI